MSHLLDCDVFSSLKLLSTELYAKDIHYIHEVRSLAVEETKLIVVHLSDHSEL